mgnify:FL=1
MYLDATFGVPKQFYQCLIIMVFDAARKIYVPCAWILMTGKTAECYWQVFNWLTSTLQDLNPSFVGVDFEWNFFRSVSNFFPDAKAIGCNFHFKQAGRNQMKKRHIPDEEVRFAMRFGVYDLLTVIPVQHLLVGIDFVIEMIEAHLEELYAEDMASINKSKQRSWSFFEQYFR